MAKIGGLERDTQNRVVKFLRDNLGFEYLGDWEERKDNSNVEVGKLIKYLRETQDFPERILQKVITEVNALRVLSGKNLYYANKDFYTALRYGVKVRPDVGENLETIYLIDWKNPQNNHFAFAEEVSIPYNNGKNSKRPDIVIYVNGIALGVLELKNAKVAIEEGIRQNLLNQEPHVIEQFFITSQLLFSGNESQGLRYGTTQTPQKYYLEWKNQEEDKNFPNKLFAHLHQLLDKERFLELIHDFIVFDKGIKKIARHNQYFGVVKAQDYIKRREGGIIWHTQGSGKSLTMVWLAKWIRGNVDDARVLLITDRTELDDQIEQVFTGVEEAIYRTDSGKDLIEKLNNKEEWLIGSLVHKFGGKDDDKADYSKYLMEIQSALPRDFKAKGNIFVFVDECHRTQSGTLHTAMKKILPDAVFIGFTGTPLLKKDKKKSVEVFGPFIDTYKFNEAVADGVVLDLRYEARDIDQFIGSQDKIDSWFDLKTRGLTDRAKTRLKQRWGTMQKVLSSNERLNRIVTDIIMDFQTKERLANGKGNAILVASSIYQATQFYKIFQDKGFKKCAIVTSYSPNLQDIKDEVTGEGQTEKMFQYDIYREMLNGKNVEDFEETVKKQFVDEPGQMQLLIVVDKLLTGFDAPSATYLYIDKKMQDHGLFQAICRVNRLDDDSKEYGYIVDYRDLFKSLEKSIEDYTSEAFADYDKEDVEGLLKNRLEMGKERLDNALDKIKALCEPVFPRNTENFIAYFSATNPKELKEKEPLRIDLYKYTVGLIRAYANIANEMHEAGYSLSQIESIKEDVRFYTSLRETIEKHSNDYIDLKQYEPAMRLLIDTYVRADDSEVITDFDDLTLIELIVERGEEALGGLPKDIRENEQAASETIENNMRKLIIEATPTNPLYYEKLSVVLDELIKERREGAKDYQSYLEKVIELTKKIKSGGAKEDYPIKIDTPAKRALYDNLGQNEELAIAMDEAIHYSRLADFRGNRIKERRLKNAMLEILPDEFDIDTIFEIVKQQKEY